MLPSYTLQPTPSPSPFTSCSATNINPQVISSDVLVNGGYFVTMPRCEKKKIIIMVAIERINMRLPSLSIYHTFYIRRETHLPSPTATYNSSPRVTNPLIQCLTVNALPEALCPASYHTPPFIYSLTQPVLHPDPFSDLPAYSICYCYYRR